MNKSSRESFFFLSKENPFSSQKKNTCENCRISNSAIVPRTASYLYGHIWIRFKSFCRLPLLKVQAKENHLKMRNWNSFTIRQFVGFFYFLSFRMCWNWNRRTSHNKRHAEDKCRAIDDWRLMETVQYSVHKLLFWISMNLLPVLQFYIKPRKLRKLKRNLYFIRVPITSFSLSLCSKR